MAHFATSGVALNSADMMVKLRDFLKNTVGWTSIDDEVTTGATSQNYVCSSPGESGNELIRLRFVRLNANAISAFSVLSWNAGTNVAQKQVGSSSATVGTGTAINTDDNNYFQYWIFASLDRVVIVTRVAWQPALTSTLYAGIYNRARSSAFRSTTGAIAAGSAVVVPLADTSIFTVGRRYVLCDDTNVEFPKVTAINPNVSITLDTVQGAYVSGARIGEDVRPTVIQPSSGNPLGIQSASWWAQAAPGLVGAGVMTAGGIAVRGMDVNTVERLFVDGPADGAGSGQVYLWPLFIELESMFGSMLLGTLQETFQSPRTGMATDDTITVGGSTYRYVEGAPASVATGATAFGMAVRQA